jgi:hypothetical protein
MGFPEYLFIMAAIPLSLGLALASLQRLQGSAANVSWWPL